MTDNKIVWIAWESDASIRSKVLSKELDAKFYTFTLFEGNRLLSILRYPIAKIQTFWTLIKERPKILIVQNPSIVLAFFTSFCKFIFNYKLIIDLHTQYIHPKGLKGWIMNKLNHYALNHCNLIIVTNKSYKEKIKKITKKKITILPDKIPDFEHKFKKLKLKGENNILYICTFSEDEPWKKVIKSAKLLNEDNYIYITGKHNLKEKSLPENVFLTGFVSNKKYQNLLRSADVIMALTTQENCLLCGGYEALAAEKPLILSDTGELKKYFKGAVFTENKPKAIAKSIRKAIKNKNKLEKTIGRLKKKRKKEWKKQFNNLNDYLKEELV